jgi:hypothetical protein
MSTIVRRPGILLLLGVLATGLATPALAQDTPPELAAREAAETWLDWLAAGEFQTTWEEAGEMFRAATTAEGWAAQAAAGHQQIGDVMGRAVAEVRTVTDPPGAPPGDYVHIRYSSDFSVIGAATETVILVREAERGWRVIGYFVQPPTPSEGGPHAGV